MLDLTIHGDLRGVRRGLDRIATTLVGKGFDSDLRGTVEILLAEVMTNIVKHAYAHTDSGRIDVKLVADDAGLAFEISDTGAPLPGSAVRAVEFDFINTPVQDLPEGGFGWQLIRNIAENLNYERLEGRNRLSFRIPLDQAETGLSFEEMVQRQFELNR